MPVPDLNGLFDDTHAEQSGCLPGLPNDFSDEAPGSNEVQHDLDTSQVQLLAIELAQDVYPEDVLLDRFSITYEQLAYIKTTKQYQQAFKEASLVWHDGASAVDRIRLKSKAVLEFLLLPALRDAILDKSYSPGQLLQLAKTLTELGDMLPSRNVSDEAPVSAIAPKLVIKIDLQPRTDVPDPNNKQGNSKPEAASVYNSTCEVVNDKEDR